MSDTPRTDAAYHACRSVGATGIIDPLTQCSALLERELTAALARIPTWTPTADLAALPPFDTYVLVYTTNEFRTIAVRSYNGLGRGWTWRGNGRMYSHDEITHWTPMPEAPEKEVAK